MSQFWVSEHGNGLPWNSELGERLERDEFDFASGAARLHFLWGEPPLSLLSDVLGPAEHAVRGACMEALYA